ncbi:TetR/AcrR family transcriptional regulator [Jatrophihabitans fulvus]
MTAAVRRGRPRDEAIDAAVLAASLDELREHGYGAFSMERVAQRAGVAKTTVYRRWPNAQDLAVDAIATLQDDGTPPPDDLSGRDQLVHLLDRVRRQWRRPEYASIMRRIAADGSMHPEVYAHGRQRLIGRTVRLMDDALQRCVDDGAVSSDVDLDLARRMIVSPVVAGAMTLRPPLTRAQVELVVDTVLRGLAP